MKSTTLYDDDDRVVSTYGQRRSQEKCRRSTVEEMSKMNTEELLKLCDGDVKLLEIVRILDKHDLGGTASNEPGEYIDEARELIAKSEKITTSSELKALLRDIHKKNFDGKFILPMRYSAVSKELTPVLLKNNL